MNKTDLLQDLHLLFLSVLLSGLAATDYFVNHKVPLDIPQAELRLPKVDWESNAIFGMFKAPQKTPTAEFFSCPSATAKLKNKTQDLKC